MATYTLTHSSIACLMTATSDPNTLAEPVELMYMKPGDICAMLPGKLDHMPAVWEALPPLVRHEASQRFAVIFAVEVSKRGPGCRSLPQRAPFNRGLSRGLHPTPRPLRPRNRRRVHYTPRSPRHAGRVPHGRPVGCPLPEHARLPGA